MGGKSLSTGKKCFPNKFVSTCRKKRLKMRKWFQQDRKSIPTIPNEKFVQKYISTREKIPFTCSSIWEMEKINLY